jgi:opacity protein-like surface antigen
MQIRKSLLLIGAASALTTSAALAQSTGTYAGDGATTPEDASFLRPSTTQDGSVGTGGTYAAYNFDLGNGFKTQIEGLNSFTDVGHTGNLLSTGGVQSQSMMLSGLYQFSEGSWKPYIGAGFGAMDFSARLLGTQDNASVTTYQFRGGVAVGLSQKLFGSMQYSWTMGSKPRLSLAGIPAKVEISRHGFQLGVNYKF